MPDLINKLSTYPALVGVICTIGGGFYAWGEFSTRLNAVENVSYESVDLTNIQGYYSDYSILGGDGLSSKFYAGNANMGRQIGAQIVYNF